jgi:hypothetical protein
MPTLPVAYCRTCGENYSKEDHAKCPTCTCQECGGEGTVPVGDRPECQKPCPKCHPSCCDRYGPPVESSVREGVWVHTRTETGRIVCDVRSPEVAQEARERKEPTPSADERLLRLQKAARALLESLGEYVRQSMHSNPEWASGIKALEAELGPLTKEMIVAPIGIFPPEAYTVRDNMWLRALGREPLRRGDALSPIAMEAEVQEHAEAAVRAFREASVERLAKGDAYDDIARRLGVKSNILGKLAEWEEAMRWALNLLEEINSGKNVLAPHLGARIKTAVEALKKATTR